MSDAHLPVRLGARAWLTAGRRGPEAYAYVLHRLTGLLLLAFLVAHVLLGASQLLGMDVWADLMMASTAPVVQALRYPLWFAFAFHAANGTRLVLVELAFFVGRGQQPVYPYRGSIRRQRPLLIGAMFVTGVLLAAGEFDVLRLAH